MGNSLLSCESDGSKQTFQNGFSPLFLMPANSIANNSKGQSITTISFVPQTDTVTSLIPMIHINTQIIEVMRSDVSLFILSSEVRIRALPRRYFLSSKYTFYAWDKSLESADEKLVLLKLADMANNEGMVSFELKDIAQECLSNEFKLANTLTSIANQGFLEKTQVERRMGREVHWFKLLLSDNSTTVQLPVYTPTDMVQNAPATIKPMEQSNAPSWTGRFFGLYNIPMASRDPIWQKFARENNTQTTNLIRLERDFEGWLDQAKQAGDLKTFVGDVKPIQKRSKVAKQKHSGSNYLSTHDLDEYDIPEWAQQTLMHAGLQIDPKLFWEKFVVYYKSRANEYISITQLLNKLRYWIVNEKQSVENRKQSEERRQLTYQNNNQRKNLSPSEEFREYLRAQGKKPNF